jgi:PHD/YefM family antitoxin component YafN of YafNO toxin-antitoxin module
MAIMIKSSEAQQNFGRIVDQALVIDDVIIERYGEPRVVIVEYHRYQQLLEAERSLTGLYLSQPDRSPEARQSGQRLAAQVRGDLETSLNNSFEDTMASLRGRSWS